MADETRRLVGLDWLATFESVADPLWVKGGISVASALFATAPGFEVRVEGWRDALTTPVILAQNHTHRHDFLPLRHWLYTRHHLNVSSWIKLRAFNENPYMRAFLEHTGNVPVGSLGYVLAGDFVHTIGRRPDEDEYRALREHMDDGALLPDTPVFRALLETPRSLMDLPFDPAQTTYREAVQRCTTLMLEASLRLARRAFAAGQHLHIYPEGLISGRLQRGHSGWVAMALALGVPVVPVGVSHTRESFRRTSPRPDARSHVTIRFGEAIHVPRDLVPEGFRPFHPEDMRAHAETFQALTDDLMDRLNDLLDPGYQRKAGYQHDGLEGVDRFLP